MTVDLIVFLALVGAIIATVYVAIWHDNHKHRHGRLVPRRTGLRRPQAHRDGDGAAGLRKRPGRR